MTNRHYTYCESYGNKILVRGVKDGKRFTSKKDFEPSLWVRVQKPTEFKSLQGDYLEQIKFENQSEYRNHLKMYSDVSGLDLFGDIQAQYQYIFENYPGKIDYNFNDIYTVVIDIETEVEAGFPNYRDPQEKVNVLTLCDLRDNTYTTFGVGKINKKLDTDYVECEDETDLFRKFMRHWSNDYPDVMTGWNIEEFDIPYLYFRMKKIMGDSFVERLSPFGRIDAREVTIKGNVKTMVDIRGIATLDYLQLYKKFSFTPQENYRLDTIAENELGENKLENPYETFREHYEKDWVSFVDYNRQDTALIKKLEDKRGLLRLAFSMAYIAKINFGDVFSPVRTWDTMIYNYLREKNIIVPCKEYGEKASMEGAFVKDPVPDMYRWVGSVDLNSLYPSIIISLNMSPETLDETMVDVTVRGLLAGDRPNPKPGYSLAANGSRYNMSKSGFLAEMMDNLLTGRREEKKTMLRAEQDLENEKSSASKDRIKEIESIISTKNSLQNALKTLANSGYGALANVGFRFFDQRIAEGITMTGQLVIQNSERNANLFLNKVIGTEKDRVITCDTDSAYLCLADLVDKYCDGKTTDQKVAFAEKAMAEKIAPYLNDGSNKLAESMNWKKDILIFKLECIADRGIFTAKKKYALHVYSSEGVRYEKPKIKVKGLEMVRTSTPGWVRDELKKAVEVVMTKTQDDLYKFVDKVESDYRKLPVEKQAFPRGANNLKQYTHPSTIYVKGSGCPIAVRAALLYNHYIDEYDLGRKYEKIKEGEKIKYIHLKEPNKFREDVLAFSSKLPEEFGVNDKIDVDLMFEKQFLTPLNNIIKSFGWEAKETASLEDLFA